MTLQNDQAAGREKLVPEQLRKLAEWHRQQAQAARESMRLAQWAACRGDERGVVEACGYRSTAEFHADRADKILNPYRNGKISAAY